MDSNPAVFVNGELLSQYIGRKVRALVQVTRNEGGVLIGQSTDGRQLTIRGSPSFPISKFVEVIGIAENQAICAEICTDFGEKAAMHQPAHPAPRSLTGAPLSGRDLRNVPHADWL